MNTAQVRTQVKGDTEEKTLNRIDNVLIVVDDLEGATAFFIELALTLKGQTTVEGFGLLRRSAHPRGDGLEHEDRQDGADPDRVRNVWAPLAPCATDFLETRTGRFL